MKKAQRGIAWILIFLSLCALLPVSYAASSTGTVNTDKVFFRTKPSTSSSYYSLLKKNTKVTVTGSSENFYAVTYGGHSGYIMKKFVDLTGSGSSGSGSSSSSSTAKVSKYASAKTIADLGSVPAATKKGSTGDAVEKLQQALKIKGYYKSTVDGIYGDGTASAVKKYQKAVGLSQTGTADKNTLNVLFGKKSANADKASASLKTEKLDWFHGGVNRIPNGATFTVKDVATGRTFTGRRLFGSNHMDSEPLTKSDAATLKSIYGGYSWNRRAILVKYNGRVYAASMNGMPHGTCHIKDNSFPGHFCIHFYGSKTHGTKRVDTGHQNAIARAMRATW